MLKSLSSFQALRRLAFVMVLLCSACSMGDSGIAPPFDRFFLPSGLTQDPSTDLLFVVNSNSDLRYNAGTLVPVDMAKAIARRKQAASDPVIKTCPKTRFSRTEPVEGDYCCWDLVDGNILNCSEPQFVFSDAAVQLGSFGGQIELQDFQRNGELIRRLYVLVRAEPSVTFVDVSVRDGVPSLRCTGDRAASQDSSHAYCDDNWRIRRPSGAQGGAFALAEEPHVLSLDREMGALFIGHLTVTVNAKIEGGGMSILDVCHPDSPESPRFAGQAKVVFPDQVSQSVVGLTEVPAADSDLRVYATARYSSEISGLVYRDPPEACSQEEGAPVTRRDLSLVPSDFFLSSAFLPSGTDIRGVLFSPDGDFAYVLHRNSNESVSNPSALVAIDRRLQSDGTRSNRPVNILKVCNGPTGMAFHSVEGTGRRIYVTCYDEGQIYVIDPNAWQVDAVIDVGTAPNSLVFPEGNQNLAYTASFAGNHVAVIDLDPQSPTRNRVIQRLGLPHGNSE